MQFLQGLSRQFTAWAFGIELLDELHKLRVDIVGIDGTSACLCQIGINRIVEIWSFSWIASMHKQLTIAFQQYKERILVQLHLHLRIGVAVLELILTLLPHKALQLGGIQLACHLTEILGEHLTIHVLIRQPFEVHDAARMEDVADVQEQAVDIVQVAFEVIHKHAQRTIHIHVQRILNILLHGVWERIVVDDAMGLLMLVEDTVRA